MFIVRQREIELLTVVEIDDERLLFTGAGAGSGHMLHEWADSETPLCAVYTALNGFFCKKDPDVGYIESTLETARERLAAGVTVDDLCRGPPVADF